MSCIIYLFLGTFPSKHSRFGLQIAKSFFEGFDQFYVNELVCPNKSSIFDRVISDCPLDGNR